MGQNCQNKQDSLNVPLLSLKTVSDQVWGTELNLILHHILLLVAIKSLKSA